MKRKIKDFKDFLECIKAGKKVTVGNSDWFYFWENRYICCKNKDGLGWYNTTIDIAELSRMEVEEQEHFTIEIGKFYKTRSGKRAYCYRFESKTEEIKEIYNFVIDNEWGFTTDERGKTFCLAPDECDIVGYWEDK